MQTLYDGFKNCIVGANLTSDGTGLTNFKIFDATSTGAFGISFRGRTYYPGLNAVLVKLDYDVQDMKIQLAWDASSPQAFLALGSAPQNFDWTEFGGYKVPAGLTGATGSVLITTVGQVLNATMFVRLHLWKGIPQG